MTAKNTVPANRDEQDKQERAAAAAYLKEKLDNESICYDNEDRLWDALWKQMMDDDGRYKEFVRMICQYVEADDNERQIVDRTLRSVFGYGLQTLVKKGLGEYEGD